MNAIWESKWNDKELAEKVCHLNRYYDISEQEFTYANLFVSIFEAGDKFEDSNIDLNRHEDITEQIVDSGTLAKVRGVG